MTPLTITEIGDPVLRQKAQKIDNIDEYQKLYQDMIQTLEDAGGVGLAAPQVGESLQAFIVRIKPTRSDPERIDQGPQIIVNPTIIDHSENIIEDREGCLSIPGATPATGLKGQVPRWEWIQAQRTDEQGTIYHKRLEGFEARVFQHEYDHLQGLFFVDRMNSMETLCTNHWYQRMQIL